MESIDEQLKALIGVLKLEFPELNSADIAGLLAQMVVIEIS